MMTMSLGPRLRVTQYRKCGLCRQNINPEASDIESALDQNSAVSAALFGAVRYSVCPLCHRGIAEKRQTEALKKRWDTYVEDRLPRLLLDKTRIAVLVAALQQYDLEPVSLPEGHDEVLWAMLDELKAMQAAAQGEKQ